MMAKKSKSKTPIKTFVTDKRESMKKKAVKTPADAQVDGTITVNKGRTKTFVTDKRESMKKKAIKTPADVQVDGTVTVNKGKTKKRKIQDDEVKTNPMKKVKGGAESGDVDDILGESLTFVPKSSSVQKSDGTVKTIKKNKKKKEKPKATSKVTTSDHSDSDDVPIKPRKRKIVGDKVDSPAKATKVIDKPPIKVAKVETETERKSDEQKEADREADKEGRDERTAFVGNLPLDADKKKLRALFQRCGVIESVRLRGAIGTKAQSVGKRIALITKNFHDNVKCLYAYVVFKCPSGVTNALKLNGADFEGFTIRVDSCSEASAHDNKFTVFLGNLSYDVTENQIHEHFSVCEPIESVRVIRDNKTGKGKGFGYIKFADSSGFCLAMKMHQSMCQGRSIRVKAATTTSVKRPAKPGYESRIKLKKAKKTENKKITPEPRAKPVKKTGILQATNRIKSSFPVQQPKPKKFKKRKFDKTTIVNKAKNDDRSKSLNESKSPNKPKRLNSSGKSKSPKKFKNKVTKDKQSVEISRKNKKS